MSELILSKLDAVSKNVASLNPAIPADRRLSFRPLAVGAVHRRQLEQNRDKILFCIILKTK